MKMELVTHIRSWWVSLRCTHPTPSVGAIHESPEAMTIAGHPAPRLLRSPGATSQ